MNHTSAARLSMPTFSPIKYVLKIAAVSIAPRKNPSMNLSVLERNLMMYGRGRPLR